MARLIVTDENMRSVVEEARRQLSLRNGPTSPISYYVCDTIESLTIDRTMHPGKIAQTLDVSLGSVLRTLSRRNVKAAGVRSRGRQQPVEAVDKETFERIRAVKEMGVASLDAAIELGVKLRIVNSVWPYPSYETYCKLR